MNRHQHLIRTVFVAVMLLTHMAQAQTTSNRQPNIVFFFVDDMGWQDTSEPFHDPITKLNRRYHTPNMERLADQGLKFTQHLRSTRAPMPLDKATGKPVAYPGDLPDGVRNPSSCPHVGALDHGT